MRNLVTTFAAIAAITAGGVIISQAAEPVTGTNTDTDTNVSDNTHCDHWYRKMAPGHKNRCNWDKNNCDWNGNAHNNNNMQQRNCCS